MFAVVMQLYVIPGFKTITMVSRGYYKNFFMNFFQNWKITEWK